MSFIDNWGLIAATENMPYSENALLYSVENALLTNAQNDKDLLESAIKECRKSPGIFDQHPSHLLTGEVQYMSRDQLIAIFAISYKYNFSYHKEIWKEIKRQWFRYNNVEVPVTLKDKWNNLQFITPFDLIFYGYCAGSFIWKLFLPLLWGAFLVSALTKTKKNPAWYERFLNWLQRIPNPPVYTFIATDGKLLAFVMMQGTGMKIAYKLYTAIIRKRFGSWNKVFRIFFPFDNHPNVIASKEW